MIDDQTTLIATRTTVWITTTFEAFHRWAGAPEEVAFLRDYHRHLFHVRVEKIVKHNNREVEFIQLKQEVHYFLERNYRRKYLDLSCEQIAAEIAQHFGAYSVTVSEDGENGATVTRVE